MTAAAIRPPQRGDSLARVTEALDAGGYGPGRRGMWRCPAHEDRSPSLHLEQGERGALVKCFAGCASAAIVSALGLRERDLFDDATVARTTSPRSSAKPQRVAVYTYEDRHGEPRARKVRLEPGPDGRAKSFVWEVPDGEGGWRRADRGTGNPRVLYRASEIAEAEEVHVGEGEKAADALAAAGHSATCPPSPSEWLPEYSEALRGKHVIVWQDRDAAGEKFAARVALALADVAASVLTVRAAVDVAHADAFDQLAAGLPIDKAEEVRSAPTAFALAEDGYVLTVPALSATFELTQLRREHHQLRGELLVRCDLAGADALDGVLSVADLNLSSTRSRNEHSLHLAERSNTNESAWASALEELAQRVLAAERVGLPDVDLATISCAAAPSILDVAGLRLPAAHPAVLFGDGDSAKSYVVLFTLGELALRGLRVGLADWELDPADHRMRLGRLFPDGLPSVRHLRCERAIVQEAERLRRWVRERRLDYVAFDSVAFASSGAPELAEVAMAYFQVVRSLGSIGTLHVAHVTKAAEGADRRPFGSAFWHNSPRATWFAKLAERDPGGTVSRLGLYPRKWNLGPLPASVGLELTFEAARTTVRRVDVADSPQLAASLTVKQRMVRALGAGAMSAKEVGEAIGATPEVVRETARRHPDVFGKAVGGMLKLVEARQ